MATTRLIPLHVGKGKTVAEAIIDRIDYANNPDKTEQGKNVTSYMCDPETAGEEFIISKNEYKYYTGRNESSNNVIAYQIRQSFKPGEITPEEALKVGYELAERFTKNKHAFVVAVHTDRHHIHSHVIFNSTALDCKRKFKNFWNSSLAVRRLSDLICLEHGLSVIENPKPSRGSYGSWLQDKPPSKSDLLKQKIDETLPNCATFEDFISELRKSGCIVKDNRKYISVKLPGNERARRLDTLGGDYSEEAIRKRIAQYVEDKKRGVRLAGTGGSSSGGAKTKTEYANNKQIGQQNSEYKSGQQNGEHNGEQITGQTRVGLLIDIQDKIKEGKGAAYEKWAKVFNLKQAAKTLIFLQENGIDSYEDLKKKASSSSGSFSALNKKIRDTELRMKEITELQKYIGQYGKTREVYVAYKKSGWSQKFYDAHTADIILHKAAKNYFDKLNMKKLPSINSLKQEWARLNVEKKNLYSGYRELKETSRSLAVALGNANYILGITPDEQNRETSRNQNRRDAQGI